MGTPNIITPKEARARLKLYAMQAGDSHIKIGITNNPEKRLQSLQTGSFHRISIAAISEHDNARLAERAWHERLIRYRTNGEWFKLSPKQIHAVVSMISSGAIPRTKVIVSGLSARTIWISPLERSGLSKRIVTALEKRGISTLDELAKMTPTQLRGLQNVGAVAVGEVAEILTKSGHWKS